MNTSQNGKKRTQSENRYNFDQPTFEDSEQDWQIPDPYDNAAPQNQDFRTHPSQDNDQLWHQPAPMRKRAEPPPQKRDRKSPVARLSTTTIITLIGLASFTFVVDLAGGGKLRHLILPAASPPESVVVSELPVPLPQVIAKVPEPEVVPAPVSQKVEPAAPLPAQIPVPQEQPEVVDAPVQEAVAPTPTVPEVTPKPLAKAAPVIAQILQGQVVRDCTDCPEVIAVSAGSYLMKSVINPADPPKNIAIDHDFAIGRNAITFDDWDKCVSDGACAAITNDAGWGRGNRPLIFVSFDDVTSQYLPWLSKVTGHIYRLPSKDEWQYAALGGQGSATKSTNQIAGASQDCFNASGPQAANCADTYDGTSPVGSFAANMLGLNDMKGNVWAWSGDCWQPFTNTPSAKSDACEMRVLLGGAWSTNRSDVAADFSGWEKSSKKANSIGFRVVRNLP